MVLVRGLFVMTLMMGAAIAPAAITLWTIAGLLASALCRTSAPLGSALS